MKWLLILFCLLFAGSQAAFAATDDVRVGLYRFAPPRSLAGMPAGAWRALAGGRSRSFAPGRPFRVVVRGAGVALEVAGEPPLTGPRLQLDSGAAWNLTAPGTPTRRYAGRLLLSTLGGKLLPVLVLPLEDYVRATTSDEMPADWPRAALAAQGLASRSYAVAERGRHAADGYDFCDLTHCQLFRGLASADARARAACDQTRGQVLTFHARPIAALWHSTCNGKIEANDAVFGGESLPYLRGGPDRAPTGKAWCAASPHARRWHLALTQASLSEALQRAGLFAAGENLTSLEVADGLPGGVPLDVHIRGLRSHELSGYALWMALGPSFGWGRFASPRFEVRSHGTQLTLSGDGLGHLVGLCQWGARGRALAGQTWLTIVRAYYPGCVVRPLRPASRANSLPSPG